MPSYLVRVSVILVASFACSSLTQARADWSDRLLKTVVPRLIQRVAISLIEHELYDLEEAEDRPHRQPDTEPDNRIPYRYAPQRKARSQSFLPGVQIAQFRENQPGLHDDGSIGENIPDQALGTDFVRGAAGAASYHQMVDARLFVSYPMRGGIFKRNAAVKYIILHSTETGSPADAMRVIRSWSNRGTRHPGAQFVVDRDGTIYSTTDPDLATVHINIKKTRPGFSNDNSVGIEIVRSGNQRYTQTQLDSVMYLVTYLQDHYAVSDEHVTTHHLVQPSDRSDPVDFDLLSFRNAKRAFRQQALAWKRSSAKYNYATPIETVVPAPAPKLLRYGPASQRTYQYPVSSVLPQPAPDFRQTRWKRIVPDASHGQGH